MTNGSISPSTFEKKTITALSSRVNQLKTELTMLERIIKKMVSSGRLSSEEKDTIDLLIAMAEDTGKGWKSWEQVKKEL